MKVKVQVSIILVFIFSLIASGQKHAVNQILAEELRHSFNDAPIIATKYQTNFEYRLENDSLKVIEADDISLISTTSYENYTHCVTFNNQIAIKDAGFYYLTGKPVKKYSTNCSQSELDGIFYSDSKNCTYQTNFQFIGTQLKFRSTIEYQDSKYFTKAFIHEILPVKERIIVFKIPKNVRVDLIEYNFDGYEIQKSTQELIDCKIITYTVNSQDRIVEEENSKGILHTYPHIVVLTKDYTTDDGRNIGVLSSTQDLYQWYSKLLKEVKIDRSSFSMKVSELLKGSKNAEDSLKAIYYWVQENIRYIAFEDGIAGFKPQSPQKVYSDLFGDCKGMSLLLREMLIIAGFDARLTWIGTSQIPYNYNIPSLAVDNHVICTVFLNDKVYILDPTENFLGLNYAAERIQGKEMLIEDGDNFIRKFVPVFDDSYSYSKRTERITLNDNSLSGKGLYQANGEPKQDLIANLDNISSADKERFLKYISIPDQTLHGTVNLEEYPILNRDSALTLSYYYQLEDKVQTFNDEKYIDLNFVKPWSDIELDSKRFSSFYFGEKIYKTIVKTLLIPAGYRVSHIPPPINESLNDISITVSYELIDNSIVYKSIFKVGNGVVEKSDFDQWNALNKELRNKIQDKIIISKIRN